MVNVSTGGGLIFASLIAMCCWAIAWRRRMRVDGVLMGRFLPVSRREARRNRRELKRDVRQTTRLARRDARESRKDSRKAPRRPADLDLFAPEPVPDPPLEPLPGAAAAELLREIRALLAAVVERRDGVDRREEAVFAGYPGAPAEPPRCGNGVAFAGDGEESW
jgi:hypothetical protein